MQVGYNSITLENIVSNHTHAKSNLFIMHLWMNFILNAETILRKSTTCRCKGLRKLHILLPEVEFIKYFL